MQQSIERQYNQSKNAWWQSSEIKGKWNGKRVDTKWKEVICQNLKHIKTITHINATTKGDEPKRDAVNATWMSEKRMRLTYQMIYIK